MNVGVWGHIEPCFAINLCNIGKDPMIWQSDAGTSNATVKRLFYDMPLGVPPITTAELSFIENKVKRK